MEGTTAATGDAQSPQAPKGQDYGERAAQMDAQSIIPIPKGASSSGGLSAPIAPENIPMPGTLPGLAAGTAYPEEPITAGLPTGPGPGPEALMMSSPEDIEIGRLREIHRRRPSSAIAALIRSAEQG